MGFPAREGGDDRRNKKRIRVMGDEALSGSRHGGYSRTLNPEPGGSSKLQPRPWLCRRGAGGASGSG